MLFLIKNYVEKLKKEEVQAFLKNENIFLSFQELEWTYQYIKENYMRILQNFDIEELKGIYSEENYLKMKNLVNSLKIKYGHYLN